MQICRSQLPLVALALWAVAYAPLIAAESRDPFNHFFHQSFGDLQEELASAGEDGKLGLFIMFDDPECPWCHKMRTQVLNQSEVQDYYRRYFRPIRVDTRGDTPLTDFSGGETTGKEFAAKVHRVRATPVLLFVDLEGRSLVRRTGPTRDVDEFLWLGEFVVKGLYASQYFEAYKRERRAARGR